MRNEIVVQVSPDFTGRICLCVGNGRLKASGPVREDEHIASLLTFIELAQAAGYQVKGHQMEEKTKLSPVGTAIDALYKIKALAQAAAFLDGSPDEKFIMIELLDVIVETASLGIERNG